MEIYLIVHWFKKYQYQMLILFLFIKIMFSANHRPPRVPLWIRVTSFYLNLLDLIKIHQRAKFERPR